MPATRERPEALPTFDVASEAMRIAADEQPPPAPPAGARARLPQLLGARSDAPSWERPALIALLVLTAVVYIWGLGASGWANSYYSAAVQAGSKSWKAFFFGSLDAGNSITVDKSPGFLWVMGISARIFGVNSWSILVPQALEGVAAVGILYVTIRRWFSPAAALIAGAVLAATPVAALMFRYNNPDALLVLLLTAAAYALTRALERGSTSWLLFAFSLVGFGFLAKMFQALMVLPAFGLVYLFAGPPRLGRRIGQLFLAGLAMLAAAGWWVLAVQLWPAASRPYIGGSQNNSLWNLMFGYNGFGRLSGNENGSVGGGAAGSRWGITGVTRLFNAEFGGQISWLLPAALLLFVTGIALTWRRPRTDRTRAALMLWGGWLLVTGAMFSFGKGIIHPYYTIALGPAVGAVIGVGGALLWSRRDLFAQVVLGVVLAATVVWSYNLLARSPGWNPWLRVVLAVGGFVVLAGIMGLRYLPHRGALVVAVGAVAVGLLGPGAYTVATAATAHGGAIPSAGPAVTNGGPGGFAPGRGRGTFQGPVGVPRFGFGAPGGFPGGGQGPGQGFGGPGRGGGMGGLLNGTTVSEELESFLRGGANDFRWVAATVNANNAASYQLATGSPVMAIGGFNGTDPSPTLAQFQERVAAHEIHYYIGGGGGRGGFGGGGPGGFDGGQAISESSAITSWVSEHFTARTVGGVTIYDLTASAQ